MASTTSSLLLPLHTVRCSVSKPVTAHLTSTTRRNFLLSTATTSLTALTLSPAYAKDIPLFGIRKKLEKAEEQAEEIVKEGLEAAEKGLETAEKQVSKAEKEIEGVAEGGSLLSLGGLAQAGIVVGAELFAVLVATSVVTGILGPEPKSS